MSVVGVPPSILEVPFQDRRDEDLGLSKRQDRKTGRRRGPFSELRNLGLKGVNTLVLSK